MKKLFDLPDESIKILNDVKEKIGFKSEVDTLIYILRDYKEKINLKETIKDIFTEVTKNDFVRFRLGVRSAEKNSILIKDMLNSLLYEFREIEYMPDFELSTHPITREAEDRYMRLIEKSNTKKYDLKGDS